MTHAGPPSSITVLVATHNGAGTLPRVLEACTRLLPPPCSWNLLVADNASTDATPEVLAAFKDRLPLQALHVPRRGKNVALNTALPQVSAELVVLSDDDIVPAPNWLQVHADAAARHPAHDLFGGAITPIWPDDTCPDWIPRLVNLGATFGITPPGWADEECPASRVWGGNMAVRGPVFAAGHRFNEQVGPAAGQYAMGSELEFTTRLSGLGHRSWFVPAATVGHLIRPHQLQPDWIIGRAYRLGRHMFHQEQGQIDPTVARFRGAPRWLWRKYLRQQLRAAWGRVRGDFDTRFSADWELSFLRGYFAEASAAAAA